MERTFKLGRPLQPKVFRKKPGKTDKVIPEVHKNIFSF